MVAPAPAPTPTPTLDPTPTIWSEFLDTLRELAGSKKAIVLLGSVIAWIAMKFGWHVDQTVIDHYLMVASAYLVGQGIADHGKGAAEVRAKEGARLSAMVATPGARVDVRPPQAGFIRRPLLAVLALFGLLFVTMGAHCGGIALMTGQCVLDTGILQTVAVDLASQNYADLIAAAIAKSPDLVKCALQAIAASQQSAPPDAGAGSAGSATQLRRGVYDPLVVARAQEMLAKHFGGGR